MKRIRPIFLFPYEENFFLGREKKISAFNIAFSTFYECGNLICLYILGYNNSIGIEQVILKSLL